MISKLLILLGAGCICVLFQGCTYKAWYEGFQEGQRNDCYTIESSTERQGCIERVDNLTYEEYKKSRNDLIRELE